MTRQVDSESVLGVRALPHAKILNSLKFYNWLQGIAHQVGYSFEVRALKEDAFPFYVEPEFIALLAKYRDKTMVTLPRETGPSGKFANHL